MVVLEGGDGQVPAPALKNLTVVGGPSVSSSVSWVNGTISQSRSYTWALRGVAPGPAEIGEVRRFFRVVQAGDRWLVHGPSGAIALKERPRFPERADLAPPGLGSEPASGRPAAVQAS